MSWYTGSGTNILHFVENIFNQFFFKVNFAYGLKYNIAKGPIDNKLLGDKPLHEPMMIQLNPSKTAIFYHIGLGSCANLYYGLT